MRFEGEQFKKEFENAFGIPIENVNIKMLWFLVKFAKHIRLRCRSNSAFNNYLNRSFPTAQFRQIMKEKDGRSYEGLKIAINNEDFETEDDE